MLKIKNFFSLLVFLCGVSIFAQTTQQYYLEIKEGHELGTVQKTTNSDQTLTLDMNNQDFASVLNTSTIYEF